jgi:hypothetical protein
VPTSTAATPWERRGSRPLPRRDVPESSAGPAAELARAFERQKAKVVQCLNHHPEHVQEHAQMSVRIALDRAGQVQSVDLLPEALSATTLGTCIAGAVRSMHFDPQAGPLTVRVPLTARRSTTASASADR